MALYEVSRNDYAGPGEFVSAYVVAGGTALARAAVSHMAGVTAKNVTAQRVDVSKRDSAPVVLSTYFDESPELPLADWERELLPGN